jgi:activating signal cointegrator 1
MIRIRAISLWQPWATLIAIGAKRFETRSWGHDRLCGLMAIHAASKAGRELKEVCADPLFRATLDHHGYGRGDGQYPLPLGAIVAVCRVHRIWRVDHGLLASKDSRLRLPSINSPEWAFGDFDEGRYAWELTRVVSLSAPIPARGHQGIWWWDVPAHLEPLVQQVREDLP